MLSVNLYITSNSGLFSDFDRPRECNSGNSNQNSMLLVFSEGDPSASNLASVFDTTDLFKYTLDDKVIGLQRSRVPSCILTPIIHHSGQVMMFRYHLLVTIIIAVIITYDI